MKAYSFSIQQPLLLVACCLVDVQLERMFMSVNPLDLCSEGFRWGFSRSAPVSSLKSGIQSTNKVNNKSNLSVKFVAECPVAVQCQCLCCIMRAS